MAYRRGDKVLVYDAWEDENGLIQQKKRPAIIYDVISEDHYCVLIYGTNRKGKIPGLWIEYDSVDGRKLDLQKDSFINLSKIVPLKKWAISNLLKGNCSEGLFQKIDEVIDSEGIEKP